MKTIQDIIETIRKNKTQLGITLYEPAHDYDIENFEQELNIKLPDDIKAFYRFCNGFESEEDMFRIIPLEEILYNKSKYITNEFYIAEYMVYCDMWTVSVNDTDNSYNISILTNSFTEFLDRFIQGGVFEENGLYAWRDKINKIKQQ